MPENSDFYAAIDLGSNSFHAVIARRIGEDRSSSLMKVDSHKEAVRLAAGLNEYDQLDEDAQQRALDCLKRFHQLIQQIPSQNVRAVGTNTLRRASNGNDFMQRAEAALGRRIDIISGLEEARLIYQGVHHDLGDAPNRRIVVDIGGGSTEFIYGEGNSPLMMDSLQIGCVHLSSQFFADGTITKAAIDAAIQEARHEMAPVKRRWRTKKHDLAIGASGTAQAIGLVLGELGITDGSITKSGLSQLLVICAKKGHADKLDFETLSADRRPVFAAGTAAMYAIFKTMQIKRMQPVSTALREGVLQDLVGFSDIEQVRLDSVVQLAKRHHLDNRHAARVARTAEYIFTLLANDWDMNVHEYGPLLHWSARLHEIGLSIAHKAYHEHGAYILRHTNLPAFSRREQEALALLVLAHRKSFPSDLFTSEKKSTHKQLRKLRKLAIILRVAIRLHRTRRPGRVPILSAVDIDKGIRLTFARGWLERHPLISLDLRQEQSRLSKAGITLELV